MNVSDATDEQLLRCWIDGGDERDFRQLVERYSGLVGQTACRVCGDRGLAAEACQATFILLAKKARQLTGRPSIAGWLHQTTIHQSRNLLRSQRRELRKRQALLMNDPGPHETASADWARMQPILDDALESLPQKDREALLLRFYRSLSFPQIARELGIGEEAARKRIDRALPKLREQLVRRHCDVGSGSLTVLLPSLASQPTSPLISISEISRTAISAAATVTPFPIPALMLTMKKSTLIATGLLLAGAATLATVQLMNRQESAGGSAVSSADSANKPEASVSSEAGSAEIIRSRYRSREGTGFPVLEATYGADRTARAKRVHGQMMQMADEIAALADLGHMINTQQKAENRLKLIELLKLTPEQIAVLDQQLADYTAREKEKLMSTSKQMQEHTGTLLELMLRKDAVARGESTDEDFNSLTASLPDELMNMTLTATNMNVTDMLRMPGATESFIATLGPDQTQPLKDYLADPKSSPAQPMANISFAGKPKKLEDVEKIITSTRGMISGLQKILDAANEIKE